MSPEVDDWLGRAVKALESAELLVENDPDGAASRAYYAAFYAVSALFANERRSFRKHSAVEAAVHRELVRSGRWPAALGKAYSRLQARRLTGDYGGELHVSTDEATAAIAEATEIVKRVRDDLEGAP